ncbi:hypothetical protein LCGC14_2721690 [marine sediment metagenome]|uniref:Uncharacterized protein n=1 Tax=marine sediment metagenome TaxID=412755 RepID=A0A0F8Z9U0_9ZZZZ
MKPVTKTESKVKSNLKEILSEHTDKNIDGYMMVGIFLFLIMVTISIIAILITLFVF